MKKFSLIIICSILLSACGFHLRSSQDLAPQFKHLAFKSVVPYSPITQYLRQTLQATGVKIAPQSPLRLNLLSAKFVKSIPSTSFSDVSQVSSVTLYYYVTYSLTWKKHGIIIPHTRIVAYRSFSVNANQMLGSNNEQNTIKQELLRDVSRQIINQLVAKRTRSRLANTVSKS